MIGPHYYKPTYYVGNWRNGFYKSTYSIQKKKIIFFSRPFWYFIFFENHCRRRVGDLLRRIQMLGRWILTRDSWENLWVVISQLLNTTQQKTMENTPQCSLRFFVYTHYYIEIESYMMGEKKSNSDLLSFLAGSKYYCAFFDPTTYMRRMWV